MKLFLPLFLFLLSLHAQAQDFTLVGSEKEYFLQAGELHQSKIAIKNNAAEPLRLAVRILEADFEGSVSPSICLGDQCLEVGGILEVNPLEPGELFDGLSLMLEAGQDEARGAVRYLIFDTDNPSNALERKVNFHIQGEFPAGIMYQRPDMKISNAYPNPIVSSASIDYFMDTYEEHAAKILVMNLLGNKVMEFELMGGEHSINIPADELSNGIYFYTLQLDGKNVATKKIVVRK
jgi:hypothetical protein